jgi:multimeric flavodoxin WrbA
MKIVFINASLRGNNGLTHRLLMHMVAGAEAEEAACEIAKLAQLEIHRCLACDRCQSSAPLGSCVYRERDEVDALFRKIGNADLVVYATPVYILGLSSLLKSLLERMYAYAKVGELRLSKSGMFFHHIPADLCSKPFVSLVCCDNFEARTSENCTDYFRAFSLFHDAEWRAHLVRDSGKLLTSDRIGSPETKQRIFAAFDQAGRDLVRLGRIRRATRTQAAQEVIPLPGFRYLKRLVGVKRALLRKALELEVAARR